MKLNIFIIIFFFSLPSCKSTNKNELTKSLFNHFGVKHCIIVGDSIENIKTAENIKYLATKYIYSIFMTKDSFLNYFIPGQYINMQHTAVIIGTNEMIETFTTLKQMFATPEMASDLLLSPLIWIIFDQPSSTFVFEIKNYYIPYNCELFIVTTINDTYYKVTETYNIGLNSNATFQTSVLGYWSNGDLTVSPESKEKRRFNMRGEKVMLFFNQQFEEHFEIDHIQDHCLVSIYPQCIGILIVKSIAEMMNATPIFHSFYLFQNWQFESTVMVMEPLRSDFSTLWLGPVYFSRVHFFIKDNIEEQYRMSAYSAPFSESVWKYILIAFLVSSCTSLVTGLLKKDSNILILFLKAAFEPIDTFCNQCGFEISKNFPSRLVWLSIQISASVLVPLYSGFIVSYLTISTPKLPFTDLESFIQDGTYKASGIEGTASQFLLQELLEKIGHEPGLKLLLNDTPVDEPDAIDWMLNSDFNYAFAWYYNYFAIGYNVRRIPKPIFSSGTGIRMRDDSPYVETYKINFHLFNTNGMVHKMRNIIEEVEKEDEVYFETVEEIFIPITLKHAWLVLYIIITGYVIALILLIIELFWKKLKVSKGGFKRLMAPNSRLFHWKNQNCSHQSTDISLASIEECL